VAENPFLPTPLIRTVVYSVLILTPSFRKQSKVEAQSALVAKFSMRVSFVAIEAKIAARCEIDLSPGRWIRPLRELAGWIFITIESSENNKYANQQLKENVENKAYPFAILCVTLRVLGVTKI